MGYPCGEIGKVSSGLETVDEYNRRKQAERVERERQMRLTGVACPKCGQELEWVRTYQIQYDNIPCTSPAHCKICSLTINLEM